MAGINKNGQAMLSYSPRCHAFIDFDPFLISELSTFKITKKTAIIQMEVNMLKKIRKVSRKISPLAFLVVTMITAHLSTFRTVVAKTID